MTYPSPRRALSSKILAAAALFLPLAAFSMPGFKQSADPFQLGLVLKGVRSYCLSLERAALDFVCLEEVSEKLDASRDKQEADVRVDPRIASGVGGVGNMGQSGRLMTSALDRRVSRGPALDRSAGRSSDRRPRSSTGTISFSRSKRKQRSRSSFFGL